jgi:hypothetical protein
MSPPLHAYLGKMPGDLGAIAISAAVLLGDRLGLFNALREGGKMTADELTARTGTQARPGNGFRGRPPPATSNMQ